MLPVLILFALMLPLPTIAFAFLPLLRGFIFSESTDSTFNYTPSESWLWRGLIGLAPTKPDTNSPLN